MRLIGAVIVVWLAGCGPTAPPPPPTAVSPAGAYAFTASVPAQGGGIWVEGQFEVAADTVLLEVEGARCYPDPDGTANSFLYNCHGQFATGTRQSVLWAGFVFWRHRPQERPMVSFTVASPTPQPTCFQWLDVRGQATCGRWMNAMVDVVRSYSAVLRVRPVP